MSVCLLVILVVWLVLVDSLVHQCHVSHAYRYSAFVLILSMLCVEKPCISHVAIVLVLLCM